MQLCVGSHYSIVNAVNWRLRGKNPIGHINGVIGFSLCLVLSSLISSALCIEVWILEILINEYRYNEFKKTVINSFSFKTFKSKSLKERIIVLNTQQNESCNALPRIDKDWSKFSLCYPFLSRESNLGRDCNLLRRKRASDYKWRKRVSPDIFD